MTNMLSNFAKLKKVVKERNRISSISMAICSTIVHFLLFYYVFMQKQIATYYFMNLNYPYATSGNNIYELRPNVL